MDNKKHSISLQDGFFFLFLIALSIMFYQMLQHFLIDLFLTLVLVIMFNKFYKYLTIKRRLSQPSSAMLTILLVIFTLLIPLSFVSTMVTKEVAHNYRLVKTEWPKVQLQFENGKVDSLLYNNKYLKAIAQQVDTEKISSQLTDLVASITQTLFRVLQSTFFSITTVMFHLLMIIFFMYFFLVDGKLLQERLQFLIPLEDQHEKAVMQKLTTVTESIVFNTFMMGVLEGVWGGVLLTIVGVPSPFFWGTLMVILSVIPLVGANSVLLPMAIILSMMGQVWQPIVLLSLGSGLVIINQNFIKPRLDGKRSGMHPAIIVISSLGGMFWMGLIGFLAGPFLAAAFVVFWNQFGKKYEHQLTQMNSGKGDNDE